MKRDWGWVELLTPATAIDRARGHLFASDGDAAPDGAWQGELESLRLKGDVPLRAGRYIARFESGGEYQHVDLRLAGGRVYLQGDDAELPARVLDLAEGE